MTTSGVGRGVPSELAAVLEGELPVLAQEIVRAIGGEVAEYARPLEGDFGRAVQAGVVGALRRFIRAIRDPDAEQERSRRIYVALGREEFEAGRTLDALQSAYRIGARVAWRHLAKAAEAAGVQQAASARLAEAIFAYIDELSAESVEGYAQAQSEHASELQQGRAELVAELLVGQRPKIVEDLAAVAGWRQPARAAALACPLQALPGLARRLGPDTLGAPFAGVGCVIVADPGRPGRAAWLAAAVRQSSAALGPEGPLERLPASWKLAHDALRLSDAPGLVQADELLAELLLYQGAAAVERLAQLRLRAFESLTATARERMSLTALAYVRHHGNAAAMARELHVHPQTARYRIARLRELLGDELDEPGALFELEVVLRMRHGTRAPGVGAAE